MARRGSKQVTNRNLWIAYALTACMAVIVAAFLYVQQRSIPPKAPKCQHVWHTGVFVCDTLPVGLEPGDSWKPEMKARACWKCYDVRAVGK